MVLSEILARETVRMDMDNMEKGSAISCLVDLLANHPGVDAPAVLEAVLERERLASTGLESGIAIPHARCNGLPGVMAALGIAREGMDFESADGKPCHAIFLVVAPARDSTRYLQVLSAVAALGGNPERMTRLRNAASEDEVIAILGEAGAAAI